MTKDLRSEKKKKEKKDLKDWTGARRKFEFYYQCLISTGKHDQPGDINKLKEIKGIK